MGGQLHAIVFAWPGQGHLNPLLRFSELLVLHGCQVTFVHTEHNLGRVTASASSATSTTNSTHQLLNFVGIKDGLPDGHPLDLGTFIKATDGLQGSISIAFSEFVEEILLQSSNGSGGGDDDDDNDAAVFFIVSDFFMAFTQDVANKFGIPRIAVFVQSAASFACHLAVYEGFRPAPGAKILGCLEGVLPATTKVSEMISYLQCYDPEDPLYDYMMRSFQRLAEPTRIVINTFDELEHGVMDYLQNSTTNEVACVGPLLPLPFLTNSYDSNGLLSESMWQEDLECLKWLDGQAPASVLFVSFGSLARISARQAEEIALGLESSMVPFLWVIREGLIEDGSLPDGFMDRIKGRSCFVTWAPQIRVLLHPSTGGFLTHCGWNSVLESIMAGVPMLGWSPFADQMLNCRCIVDNWSVGLSLSFSSEFEEDKDEHVEDGGSTKEPQLIKRTQVEKKVRQLMHEVPLSMKERCAWLKEAASASAETRNELIIKPLLQSLEGSHPVVVAK